MAMTGVRDLSLIETPPEERLPIKTYVTAYRPQLVRELILREMDVAGRCSSCITGGDDREAAEELEALVPEARIIVGHGQMHETP